MYVNTSCVSLVLQKSEDCIGSSGRVCDCWELNPGPLQAQQVLLASEPVSTHFNKINGKIRQSMNSETNSEAFLSETKMSF